MFAFIFEYGIETDSWNAELAFRRRVSMSAIGSVIDIGQSPFPSWFPIQTYDVDFLPAGLLYAWELAVQGHLTQADTAKTELAVYRMGTAAALTARIGADSELRLAICFFF